MSDSSLKMVCHSIFNSVTSFGIMFWGNSSHSSTIFKMQKRVIRIMIGCSNRDLFKKLENLACLSQNIYFLY
jgi:hypothetical protein